MRHIDGPERGVACSTRRRDVGDARDIGLVQNAMADSVGNLVLCSFVVSTSVWRIKLDARMACRRPTLLGQHSASRKQQRIHGRQRFRDRFTAGRMVQETEAVYRRALAFKGL